MSMRLTSNGAADTASSDFVVGASLQQPLMGRSILLVEDEMLVLMDAEDMLADLGCRSVSTAATVDQALSLIGTEFLDAALLDVNLNGDRSYPVADALAARGIPFAFATGYGAHGLRPIDCGRPLLMKPYRLDQFAKAFADILQ
jgi:CheY-like chemotaxis protein